MCIFCLYDLRLLPSLLPPSCANLTNTNTTIFERSENDNIGSIHSPRVFILGRTRERSCRKTGSIPNENQTQAVSAWFEPGTTWYTHIPWKQGPVSPVTCEMRGPPGSRAKAMKSISKIRRCGLRPGNESTSQLRWEWKERVLESHNYCLAKLIVTFV